MTNPEDETTPATESTATTTEATGGDDEALEAAIVAALQTVYDPEIPVDIYQLGLIYNIAINDTRHVDCTMTLTSPGCPVAGTLPGEVENTIASVDGVNSVTVELVWDPAWNPSMMSEAAKLELGML